ncbi:MFS transporter [Stutzerimonas stutzeri]|uniref:MFS transporter n=1 Tax=Stutzerimonas stutzeri TaxID=316 RepID=UPI00244C8C2A|nr:MFS transporter [Stutzerimonas stutzeri]MDH0428041.1 MFS transporter [Stutzerimonas stutzeri]
MKPSTVKGSAAESNAANPPAKLTARVLFVCWLAILFEGYDVGVMGAILPSMAEDKAWNLTPLELGALSSYALLGMFFGAFLIGTLSELVGRRKMLLMCVTLFSLTMGGAAWAPTPEWFGAFRFIGGLGLGGVIPVAAALTIEYSAQHRRSFNYGIMYSGYSIGILTAAAVAMWLIQDYGWRTVVGLGLLPLIAIWPMARALPDSIENLVSRGRQQEAEQLSKQLGVSMPQKSEQDSNPGTGWREVLAEVFSKRHLRATVCFWLALFCGLLLIYALNTWLPSIMRRNGYDLGSSLSLLVVFSLASAIGGMFLGKAADRFGVRVMVTVFYLLGALAIFALMWQHSMFVNYVLVAIAGVGTISASLILTGHLANYYPSNVRAAATGWGLSFSRLGAMSGPILGGYVAGSGLGVEWNFITFAVIAAIAAVAVAFLPRRSKNHK